MRKKEKVFLSENDVRFLQWIAKLSDNIPLVFFPYANPGVPVKAIGSVTSKLSSQGFVMRRGKKNFSEYAITTYGLEKLEAFYHG